MTDMKRTLLFIACILASMAMQAQEYFPEGTKWTEIRLDTLKYDSWYSKVGDEWVPNFETIEYYVKGEYIDEYNDKFRCVYSNGPEWTDSLALMLQEEGDAEYVKPKCIMVSVFLHDYYESGPLWPAEAYDFDWSVGKGLYYTDISMSNTTSSIRGHAYYGIIDEIKEGNFGGVRPLKYVDLDGIAPANDPHSNIKNGNTKGGRIIQGIGITEWNDGECLFGPPDPYGALDGEYHGRHYRSMLVHFERNGEVLYNVWPEKLPQIEINEQNFPDELFRKWVLNQEYGKDGILTEKEIAGVTFMNLFPQNLIAVGHIKSLKGIEYFTAVTKIVCSMNELTELDLSKNTALTCLECYGNHLTKLDLSKNTELTILDCSGNELTALNVSCCNKLTELNCIMNELTELDLSKNTALTWLECYGNHLTKLDLSKNTALTTLDCNGNELTALNVLDCASLSSLRCDNNRLTQLDMSENTELSSLVCNNNQLTQLDVSKNTELTELRCHENQLTALDLSKNKKLKTLRTYHNPINGVAMDALIESLPKVSRGVWSCVLNKDEEGSPTTTQVAAAKKKGWTSYYWDEAAKSWKEYAGTEAPQMAYHPFVEDDKVWIVRVIPSWAIPDMEQTERYFEYYYFDGDTIINEQTAKRMLYDRIGSNWDTIGEYIGAWYEQDKKVYYAGKGKQQFELLYDFTLSTGDIIQSEDLVLQVTKMSGGIPGFKGTYYDLQYINYTPIVERWLEGVGSEYYPWLNLRARWAGAAVALLVCKAGDEIIYYNSEEEDPFSMGAKKHRFDFTHTIKTKPKARTREDDAEALYGEYNNQLLDIRLNPLDATYLVRITNESDQVVYEKTINAGSIVGLNIDISAFAKGRYTVTMENSSEVFTGEFETITTGIQELKNSRIEELKSIYNLQGQRLNRLQKGLNIVNGRKVFVK